jgi:RHS repeat-associated protein
MNQIFRALALAASALLGAFSIAADIEPPQRPITDKFGVNMANGQVTHSLGTVSIGGAMGLSHNISVFANEFNFAGMRGFPDKYFTRSRWVELSTAAGYSPRRVLRVSDPGGSADFKIYVNGVLCENVCDATSNYHYVAVGDERHTLEVSGADALWTKPDGTIARFSGGTHAANVGSLVDVTYPNGFRITVAGTNTVSTNTGYTLQYFYEADTRPFDKPDNPGLINVAPASSSAASGWSGANPKYIKAINAAVCNPGSTSCLNGYSWPTATFEWPAGMPRTMFIGNSDVSVKDPMGRVTRYRFRAHDLAYADNGAVMPPYTPGREMSPRLVAVKTHNSTGENLTYAFKNVFGIDGSEFGMYDFRLQSAGVTKLATLNGLQSSYEQVPSGYTGVTDTSNPNARGGLSKVRPNPNINGNPTALEFVDTEEGRLWFENASARNFRKAWAPTHGPREDYTYATRGNMTRITYRQNEPDATSVEAQFPDRCSNRKTCNQATRTRDARGNWTDYTYHPQSGQVASITRPADKYTLRAQTRYTYELKHANYYQNGSYTAGPGIWMKTAEKYCINSPSSFPDNYDGTPYSGNGCAGGDEVVTQYQYDPDHNLALIGTTVSASGVPTLRTCFKYDRYGNQTGKTEPNANLGSCAGSSGAQAEAAWMHATRYNLSGQVTGTIAPDPDRGGALRLLATRNTYGGDARKLLVKTETGQLTSFPNEDVPVADWGSHGFTVHTTRESGYDSFGRKTSDLVRDTNGAIDSIVNYAYDSEGRIHCKAVRMNRDAFASLPGSACTPGAAGSEGPDRITVYTYDNLDQVLQEVRGYLTPFEQVYVTNTYVGRKLTSQKDANGNVTLLEYDNYSRLRDRFYPSRTVTGAWNHGDSNHYEYDANGNLVFEKRRDNTTITYTNDANNRPIFKNLSDNTHSGDVVYDYDLRGLARKTKFGTYPSDDSGAGITNVFNGHGKLESTWNTTGGFTRGISYQYDLNGNRTRISHPDDHLFEYSFDGLNRVIGVRGDGADPALITVQYRPNGQRMKLTRPNGAVTTFNPDPAQRLASIDHDFNLAAFDVALGFAYNAANQATRRTESNPAYQYFGSHQLNGSYQPNGLNQYTTVNGVPAGHDANGNLTSVTGNKESGVAQTFVYDMENRLVGSTNPTGTLKYDPTGRLIETSIVPGVTTQFLYDGDALVGEYAISGTPPTQTLTKRYVHGDRVDEPWLQYTGNSLAATGLRHLHADHQGSIVAHSNSSGEVPALLKYDAYGVPDPNNVDRFGYTGQAWIPQLGLNYYKARMFSPRLGRFLQTDPIAYSDGMNIYAYVGNDPVNLADSSGLCPACTFVRPLVQPPPPVTSIYRPNPIAQAVRQAIQESQRAQEGMTRLPNGERTAVPKYGETGEAYLQRAQQIRQQEAAKLKEGVAQPEKVGKGPPSAPWWFRAMDLVARTIQHLNDNKALTSGLPGTEDAQEAPPADPQSDEYDDVLEDCVPTFDVLGNPTLSGDCTA